MPFSDLQNDMRGRMEAVLQARAGNHLGAVNGLMNEAIDNGQSMVLYTAEGFTPDQAQAVASYLRLNGVNGRVAVPGEVVEGTTVPYGPDSFVLVDWSTWTR